MKKKIAVAYGGYSSEKSISKGSADGVCSFIDKEKFDVYPVLIDKKKWCAIIEDKEYTVSKEDFSFVIDGQKIVPDCIYNTIHGTPGEDGLLQGYLKMLGIPHTSSDVFTAALTYDKKACKIFLNKYGFNSAKFLSIRKDSDYTISEIVSYLGFPCFVKPNTGGSSFGITKVNYSENLETAIDKAFEESDDVIIEEFIEGIEITCGLYKTSEKSVVFPLTLIISENEFFDFEAKYTLGKSQEITPAPIDAKIATEIENTSSTIYDLLGCRGFIRIDYIIKNDKIFLLEVNSNPGMTSRSIVPQQIAAKGLNITDIFTDIIEDSMKRSEVSGLRFQV